MCDWKWKGQGCHWQVSSKDRGFLYTSGDLKNPSEMAGTVILEPAKRIKTCVMGGDSPTLREIYSGTDGRLLKNTALERHQPVRQGKFAFVKNRRTLFWNGTPHLADFKKAARVQAKFKTTNLGIYFLKDCRKEDSFFFFWMSKSYHHMWGNHQIYYVKHLPNNRRTSGKTTENTTTGELIPCFHVPGWIPHWSQIWFILEPISQVQWLCNA